MTNRNSLYKSGFTIVELLIVIVVIGILAAITVVAFNGIQERAESTRNISTARSFVTAFKILEQDETLPESAHCLGDNSMYGGTTGTCSVFGTPGTVNLNLNEKLNNNGASSSSKMSPKWSAGRFYYHPNWFGDHRILLYYLGPNQDCGVNNVLSFSTESNKYDNMPLTGAGYTDRSDTGTTCFISLEDKR